MTFLATNEPTFTLNLTETELAVITRLLVCVRLGSDNEYKEAASSLIGAIESELGSDWIEEVTEQVGFDAQHVDESSFDVLESVDGSLLAVDFHG